MGCHTRFYLADPRQCLVPAPLEFRCHQTIRRINCVVLPEGTVGSVACCFEVPAQGVAYFVTLDGHLPVCLQRRRNRAGLEHFDGSRLDGVIDP